jgi:hypothetical protein
MKPSGLKESLGVLLKEEALQTVEHNILENTLVLESIEPFPSYHGENMPSETKPDSIFLITDKNYPDETIFRVSQHLCCYEGIAVDACPAEIFIHSTTYYAIRIRGLHNYVHIKDIQKCYVDRNIQFMKIKNIKTSALIRVTKVFSIAKLQEGIYHDLDDENTYYIALPYHFNREKFWRTTGIVKNNMDNSNFDCAAGFIYSKEMMEFVRIYAQNIPAERLTSIREKYLEEIAKIRDDAM